MNSQRLDNYLANRGIVETRSQAESYIKLGQVQVDGRVVKKPGTKVTEKNAVKLTSPAKYVSRGGLKLASAAEELKLDFRGKSVLDVGSSTGGFTDFALKRGASKIIAVDSGSKQLHPRLRPNPNIELHEQTDIRDIKKLSTKVDIVLIDVSFISLRKVLPHIGRLVSHNSQVVAMVKPQFEATDKRDVNRGVIKNNSVRRKILKEFEQWVSNQFKILSKADSKVPGEKGNVERFYLLSALS